MAQWLVGLVGDNGVIPTATNKEGQRKCCRDGSGV